MRIRTGAALVVAAVFAGMAAAQDTLTVSQTAPSTYTPGGTVDVQIAFAYTGGSPVSALGFRVTPPANWSFQAVVSGEYPALMRTDSSPWEFGYIIVPTLPFSVTIRMNVPPGEGGNRQISTQAEYRTTGSALFSNTASSTLGDGNATDKGCGCSCGAESRRGAGLAGDVSVGVLLLGGLLFARRRLLASRAR